MPSPLVLASTSKYRKAQLERLGLLFACEAPQVDEAPWQSSGRRPEEIATGLALAKAREVFGRFPASRVIGGDQVPEVEGEILGKPETSERACEQLARLSGRSHRLLTAICVVDARGEWSHLEVATLTMRRLSGPEIEAYVARDKPLDCAGSYKLEAAGIGLFERIECADWTSIEGVPLLALAGHLARD